MKTRCTAPSLKIAGIISACGGGDWPPLLSLALGMKARGHDVVMVCDSGTMGAVRAAGLSVLCLPSHLHLSNFFERALQRIFSTGEDLTSMTPNPLKEWAEKSVSYITEHLGKWSPSLILGSLLCLELGKVMARRLKKPWCFVNPGFHFGDTKNRPRKEDFSYIGAQMYEHWLLPPLKKAMMVLHVTDPVFDKGHGPLPSNHYYTGPLFWEKPAHIPEYLHEPGPPWILISLSTAPQTGDMEIVRASLSALEAFENQAVRVLVTLAPGHGRPLPAAVPGNVFIEEYIPHSIALGVSRLAICHAGHGMVIKAIYHGTPMVLVPWGRDQPGVASRAEALGVASVVSRKDCNVPTLAAAIKKTITSSDISSQARAESRRLKSRDALTLACCRLESVF